MSQIPTYRPAPNTPASASDLNGLFTGTASATGALDNNNVRSQAVDIAQIDTQYLNDEGRVTRFVGRYDTPFSSSLAASSGTTATIATWDLVGSGTGRAELDIGNIARIYTSFKVKDITIGTAQYGGTAVSRRAASQQFLAGAGWLFWLEWDLTSAALANFVPVPGQEDFGNHVAGVVDQAGNPVPHMRTKFTASTMLVPHLYGSVDRTASTPVYLNPVDGEFSRGKRRSRAYHYKRTGTNGNIFGLRLRCRGVVSIGIDPAGTGDGIFYVRDTVLYGGGGADWNDYSYNNEGITVQNVSFHMLVQKAQ